MRVARVGGQPSAGHVSLGRPAEWNVRIGVTKNFSESVPGCDSRAARERSENADGAWDAVRGRERR